MIGVSGQVKPWEGGKNVDTRYSRRNIYFLQQKGREHVKNESVLRYKTHNCRVTMCHLGKYAGSPFFVHVNYCQKQDRKVRTCFVCS